MKTSEKTFESSLAIWANFYPKEAVWLSYLEPENYQIENENLKGPFGFYHSSNPSLEAKEWFESLSLKPDDVLIVYGMGLGYLYKAAKEWLKSSKKARIVFFEDDLNVLKWLFATEVGWEILSDPQAEIHYFKSLSGDQKAFDNFYWSSIGQNLVVEMLPAFKIIKKEFFDDFKHSVLYDSAIKNALVQEYLEYSVPFFRNFYKNILALPDSYIGNKLFKKFKNVPAVICGAGPSLEKHFDQLKEIQDKALLFAGGSSLNALSFHGVKPDFGCGIDPNSLQVTRLKTNKAGDIPFFYRNRFHYQALELVSGPRLLITGSGGYDISEYYEKKLKLPSGAFDEGHNVVNFLIEIATRLGCSPIILVGLDLGYTGMKTYSKGIVPSESVSEKEILNTEDFDSKAILRKDIEGNPFYTQWKWLAEADWISNFQKENPKQKIINATEGGLGIDNIPNMTLANVIEKYISEDLNLKEKVQAQIELAKKKGLTKKRVVKVTEELKASLERCIGYLTTLYDDAETRMQMTHPSPISLDAAVAETELSHEDGFNYIIAMFNAVYTRLQNNQLQQLKSEQGKVPEEEIEKRKLKIQNERVRFLIEAAQINVKLIDWALKQSEKTR